jgi:hypothetical protein
MFISKSSLVTATKCKVTIWEFHVATLHDYIIPSHLEQNKKAEQPLVESADRCSNK